MKKPHLLYSALSTPWAMMPERMSAYAAFLVARWGGLPVSSPIAGGMDEDDHGAPLKPEAPSARAPARGQAAPGGIAVVPVSGPIVEWPGDIDMCEGGTASRVVSRQLLEAEADETVGQILMVFNTPGGSVYGTKECADIINRVKAKKPVYGVAQSLSASAGYWLLSQCTEAYCTPGGEVGSIGVFAAHQDISRHLDAEGVGVSLISAGKYKTEGSPFEPLSDEARAAMQSRVNDYYGLFVRAVAKGRGVGVDDVRGGFGEGRVVGAQQAVKLGMADRVDTYDATVARLARGGARPSGQRADGDAPGLSDDSRRRRARYRR